MPVTTERGTAAVAASRVASPLGLTLALDGSRVTVGLSGVVFVFQLGAPFVRAGGVVYGLVGEPYVARDTVWVAATAGSPPPQEIWDDWWSCLWRAQW